MIIIFIAAIVAIVESQLEPIACSSYADCDQHAIAEGYGFLILTCSSDYGFLCPGSACCVGTACSDASPCPYDGRCIINGDEPVKTCVKPCTTWPAWCDAEDTCNEASGECESVSESQQLEPCSTYADCDAWAIAAGFGFVIPTCNPAVGGHATLCPGSAACCTETPCSGTSPCPYGGQCISKADEPGEACVKPCTTWPAWCDAPELFCNEASGGCETIPCSSTADCPDPTNCGSDGNCIESDASAEYFCTTGDGCATISCSSTADCPNNGWICPDGRDNCIPGCDEIWCGDGFYCRSDGNCIQTPTTSAPSSTAPTTSAPTTSAPTQAPTTKAPTQGTDPDDGTGGSDPDDGADPTTTEAATTVDLGGSCNNGYALTSGCVDAVRRGCSLQLDVSLDFCAIDLRFPRALIQNGMKYALKAWVDENVEGYPSWCVHIEDIDIETYTLDLTPDSRVYGARLPSPDQCSDLTRVCDGNVTDTDPDLDVKIDFRLGFFCGAVATRCSDVEEVYSKALARLSSDRSGFADWVGEHIRVIGTDGDDVCLGLGFGQVVVSVNSASLSRRNADGDIVSVVDIINHAPDLYHGVAVCVSLLMAFFF